MNRLKNFNWRLALLAFVICQFVLMATACGATISEISNMLPSIGTLLSAIVAFVTGLSGTLSSTTVATATTVGNDAQAAITEAESELKAWTQSTSTTVLGKISSLLTGVQSTLNNFLSGLNITNPATLQKLQGIVSLALTAVEGVLALIPMFGQKLATASPHELAAMDKLAANQVKALHQGIKDGYKAWVETPTGDSATDAALSKCPKSL